MQAKTAQCSGTGQALQMSVAVDAMEDRTLRLRNIPEAKEIVEGSPFVIQEPARLRGRWSQFWQNSRPLHLEAGMGKGKFLMEMSQKHPENNYLGMERYGSVLLRAIQRRQALERPLGNLYFLCTDARMLPDIFGEKEVQKIYLNFSDPWPKTRHCKRRLTSRQFLNRYRQILSPGASMEFKTDNRELFEFSLKEAEAAGWRLENYTYDLHNTPEMNRDNIMTEYEEKFSALGKPICKLIAHPA